MSRARGVWVTAGLVAAAVAGALSCRLNPVRLGLVLPLTGPLAPYGKSLKRGAELAADRVNASGGVEGRRLELIVSDSMSNPEEAAKAFRNLVEGDKVAAVVGGASSAEFMTIAPVADRYRRILLSPSASAPRMPAKEGFAFRNWPSDEVEGRTLADFTAYTLHVSHVLVIAERTPYAEGFREVFSRRFCVEGRTCESIAPDPAKSPALVVSGLSEAIGRSQAVVLAGYSSTLLPLLAALRAHPALPPVLSVSALDESACLRNPAAEGVLFARPSYDVEGDPDAKAFASAYADKFDEEPDLYAAHAYDAVRLLGEIIARVGPGSEEIRRGLLAVRNYPGVSGSTTFDAGGDVIQTYQICVAEGGRALPLKSVIGRVLPALQQRVDARRFGK